LLVAGTLSGIACLVLVPASYKLAVWTSDRLFGPARMCATVEGGRMVAREIAPQRWIGGLLVAFVAGLALLGSGKIRSRYRLNVKQYWATTLLLACLSLVALFLMRALS
jgi:hypothetical protein